MSATHDQDRTTPAPAPLYLAFELGWTSWGLAFSTAPAQPARRVTIPARDLDSLRREIDRARRRFGLPDDAPVRSCYEAGRDGFWLHRSLVSRGVDYAVVDASSIEVNRRARRAKSDAIDVGKLLAMPMRYHGGERDLWSVINFPAPEDEDRRQPDRDRAQPVRERTEHINRIKGLLANPGLGAEVDGGCWSGSTRCGNGTARRCRRSCGGGSHGSGSDGGWWTPSSASWATAGAARCGTTMWRTSRWCGDS